jgi:hypothetical protein
MAMTQTCKPSNAAQKVSEVRVLKDHELETVSGGGSALQSAFSNVLKSIGEGLASTASKG